MEDTVVPQYKAVLTTVLLLLLSANKQLASSRTDSSSGLLSAGQAAIPSAKRDTLLNELQLIVLPNPGSDKIRVHLRVNSGAMFDLAGKGGLADLTGRMLLRTAKGLSASDLSEYLTQQGLTLDLRVGWDSTDITMSGPAASLEPILDLLGRMIVSPGLGELELDSLIAARMKELATEKGRPTDLAREAAMKTLYGRYPLGKTVQGTTDSISKINRNDILYFHDKFYIANDAELAVEGDILAEEVPKLARSKLGIWKKGEKVPASFLPPEPLGTRRIVLVDRPDSPSASLAVAGHGISRRADDYLASA